MAKDEYTLSLIDDISPKLDDISQKLSDTEKRMDNTGKTSSNALKNMTTGASAATNSLQGLTSQTVTLQNASNKRIREAIEGLRKERSALQQNAAQVNSLTIAHKKNSTAAVSSLSQQFNYSKRLTTQFNMLATRMLGIGGAYATIRYLSNALKDAGLNTETFDKNVSSVSATIGNELLPIAENGMKWFNENYQVITQGVLNFGRTISIVFNGLASLPVGVAAAFYKLRPKIDYALGIRGPALEKSKREAEIYGKSYAESFVAELEKINTTILSMSELPEMIQPKRKKDKENKVSKSSSNFGTYNIFGPSIQEAEQNHDAILALSLKYSQLGMTQRQKELDDEKRRYQEELEAAGVTDELKQAALDIHRQKMQEINDHYDEIEKEKTEKLEEEKNKIRQTYQVAAIDAAQQVSNAIFSITQQSADREANREIKKINDKFDGNKKLTKAEKEKEKEIEKVQKEAFEKGKRRAIAQALIDGALGAAKTVATLGWPAAIPMLIVQGIATASQIAVIASQKFARGGVVQQEPGVPSTGDRHIVGVNPGEIILTPEQFSNLRSGASSTSGGQIVNFQTTLNLSGQINSAVMDRLEETLEDHREKIREDLRVLQTSGRISGITFE